MASRCDGRVAPFVRGGVVGPAVHGEGCLLARLAGARRFASSRSRGHWQGATLAAFARIAFLFGAAVAATSTRRAMIAGPLRAAPPMLAHVGRALRPGEVADPASDPYIDRQPALRCAATGSWPGRASATPPPLNCTAALRQWWRPCANSGGRPPRLLGRTRQGSHRPGRAAVRSGVRPGEQPAPMRTRAPNAWPLRTLPWSSGSAASGRRRGGGGRRPGGARRRCC